MEHVKLREKIGYGLGDAASSMFWKLFTMYLLAEFNLQMQQNSD